MWAHDVKVRFLCPAINVLLSSSGKIFEFRLKERSSSLLKSIRYGRFILYVFDFFGNYGHFGLKYRLFGVMINCRVF